MDYIFIPFLLSTLFFLAGPVLAIIALVRVKRLEKSGKGEKREEDGKFFAGRLAALEGKIGELSRRLEQAVAAWETARPAAPAQATQPPSPAPPSPPAVVVPVRSSLSRTIPPAASPTSWIDLETVIAGRWLNRIGIVAVLLAVAFFLKFAFDNDWVGPGGRVTIGLLAGAGLLVFSQFLLRWGYRYFADGMTGLGAGVLYLSLFAAWDFYRLIPQGMAFATMIAVTGALIAIAVGRDSQPIAFLALTGGFLTPILLSTGRDAQIELFTYVAVLNAGLLVLARARNWRALEPVALFGTLLYFIGWYDKFYDPSKLGRTIFFATFFFTEFAALPVVRSRRQKILESDQLVLVLFNAGWYLVALHEMLYQEHRWSLTVAVLVLAAAHLGVVRLLPAMQPPMKSKEPSVTRLVFAGLALTFVTLAIPIRLEGKWITLAWAIESAVIIWSGFQGRVRYLRTVGLVLFWVVAARLLFISIPAERFLFNERFATFAGAVACFGAALVFARRNETEVIGDERNMFIALGVAVHVFTLIALSLEVWDVFSRMEMGGIEPRLAQQLALSLLWTLYATGLIVTGVRRSLLLLRWQGLALFGLVVGKVFLFDFSYLDRAYRIISFMVLGVLLLVVSFLYQKRLAAGRSEEK